MTERIPENCSEAKWRLVTIIGNTMPPRVPNDDVMMTRTKTTTPNRTTSVAAGRQRARRSE